MTMNFELIEDAVVTLLVAQAAGRFTVIKGQQQVVSAEEALSTQKLLQVYYAGGEFPKGGAGLVGPFKHDIQLTLEFTVAMLTSGNLLVFEDEDSTPAQLMAAATAMVGGDQRVHLEMRSFFRDVFQILMAGTATNPVSNVHVSSRWIDRFQKDNILRQGEFAMLKGRALYSCQMDETVLGVTGNALDTIDMGLQHNGDAVYRAGVKNVYTP